MFETAFDILSLDKVVPENPSLLQRAKHAVDMDDGQEGIAFLYGQGRRPFLVQYQHWSTAGGRMTSSHHGVIATFVDLSRVTSVIREGSDLVLHGTPRFVWRCDTYHAGYSHLSALDPFEGYGEAKAAKDASVRFEGVCDGWEPSPYDIVTEYLKGRGESVSDSAPEVDVSPLESSEELCEKLRKWHAEHPDEDRQAYEADERRRRRITWGVVAGLMAVAIILAYVGLHSGSLASGSVGLFDVGAMLFLVACMIPVLMSFSGMRRSFEEGERRMREERIVDMGQASVVREGDVRYLLCQESPFVPFGSMTTYTLVRLTDGNLSPAYDEDTRILTFVGDGIWQTESVRDAIDKIIVPSRDVTGMQSVSSYRIADTFIPSLRTVVRMTGGKSAELDG